MLLCFALATHTPEAVKEILAVFSQHSLPWLLQASKSGHAGPVTRLAERLAGAL